MNIGTGETASISSNHLSSVWTDMRQIAVGKVLKQRLNLINNLSVVSNEILVVTCLPLVSVNCFRRTGKQRNQRQVILCEF